MPQALITRLPDAGYRDQRREWIHLLLPGTRSGCSGLSVGGSRHCHPTAWPLTCLADPLSLGARERERASSPDSIHPGGSIIGLKE